MWAELVEVRPSTGSGRIGNAKVGQSGEKREDRGEVGAQAGCVDSAVGYGIDPAHPSGRQSQEGERVGLHDVWRSTASVSRAGIPNRTLHSGVRRHPHLNRASGVLSGQDRGEGTRAPGERAALQLRRRLRVNRSIEVVGVHDQFHDSRGKKVLSRCRTTRGSDHLRHLNPGA